MRRDPDPDLLLVQTMLAPPTVEDARRSLDYWQRRLGTLPLYRRSARREAKEMTNRWQDRVRAAEQARFASSPLGRLLTAIGISSLSPQWMRFRRRGLLLFAWDLVPRPAKLVAGSIVTGWLLMSVAMATAVVVALVQLA